MHLAAKGMRAAMHACGSQIRPRTMKTSALLHSGRVKVALLGASGDLGPSLALLLHQSPQVDELALVDASPNSCALADELNALDNRAEVVYHHPERTAAALQGADVVLLADNALRVPGQMRRARITRHAEKAAAAARLVGQHCPQALVLVLTAPVSGVVPVVVEAARRAGVLHPERRVLGVAAVAKARAAAMVGSLLDEDPFHIEVPVTGGTSASASVPLLSQVRAQNALTKLEAGAVVSAVQSAGSRLARIRYESSLPALGVAFAAARFTDNVINAVLGEAGVREHAFVACGVVPGMSYMTAPVELHRGGATVLPLGPMTATECALLRAAARLVQRDLDVAEAMVRAMFGPRQPPGQAPPPPRVSPELPKEIPAGRCPSWLPQEGCM